MGRTPFVTLLTLEQKCQAETGPIFTFVQGYGPSFDNLLTILPKVRPIATRFRDLTFGRRLIGRIGVVRPRRDSWDITAQALTRSANLHANDRSYCEHNTSAAPYR